MPPKSRKKSGKKRTERSFSTSPQSTDTTKKARMNSSEGMQETDKISQLFGLIEGLGERIENSCKKFRQTWIPFDKKSRMKLRA